MAAELVSDRIRVRAGVVHPYRDGAGRPSIMGSMQGTPLDPRRRALLQRLRHVTDPAVLDAVERLLDERSPEEALVPLEDAEVDAILRRLLAHDPGAPTA